MISVDLLIGTISRCITSNWKTLQLFQRNGIDVFKYRTDIVVALSRNLSCCCTSSSPPPAAKGTESEKFWSDQLVVPVIENCITLCISFLCTIKTTQINYLQGTSSCVSQKTTTPLPVTSDRTRSSRI